MSAEGAVYQRGPDEARQQQGRAQKVDRADAHGGLDLSRQEVSDGEGHDGDGKDQRRARDAPVELGLERRHEHRVRVDEAEKEQEQRSHRKREDATCAKVHGTPFGPGGGHGRPRELCSV